MGHGLPRRGAVVLEDVQVGDADGTLESTGEPRQHSSDGSRRFLRKLAHGGTTLPRNHQEVSRALRSDVQERDDPIVFVHPMAGNLSSQNAVEEGGLGHEANTSSLWMK